MKINESGRLESCFLKFETQGDIWHYSIKRKIHLEQEKNAFNLFPTKISKHNLKIVYH